MAFNDKKQNADVASRKALEPESLSFIERIFYYENLKGIEADNDNKTAGPSAKDAACFESWALPDYMRK